MAELLEDWVCPAVQAPSQGNGYINYLCTVEYMPQI